MIILTPASLSFFATIHMRHSPVSSKKCEAASSLSLNWIGVTGVPTSCEWGCSRDVPPSGQGMFQGICFCKLLLYPPSVAMESMPGSYYVGGFQLLLHVYQHL